MGYNLNSTPGVGGLAKPLEDGAYPGMLMAFIDLGIQEPDPFKGQKKLPRPHFMLTWAFAEEMMEDEDGNDTKEHRVQSEKMGAFPLNSDRATSTKRYHVLDPKGEHEGDMSACVGTFVTLGVKKKERKVDGRPYNVIADVLPMRPKELERMPELNVKPFIFLLDDPEEEAWNRLFPWQKDLILGSLNLDPNTKQLLETWNQGDQESEEGKEPASNAEEVESPY